MHIYHSSPTIQAQCLSLYGHIECMEDNADAKRFLAVSPPEEWRRLPGGPYCLDLMADNSSR